jgi:DNA-directed RNA polymerase subunit RPC12/RpoP
MVTNHSYHCYHCDNYVYIEGGASVVTYCPFCGSKSIMKTCVNAKDPESVYNIRKEIQEINKKYDKGLPTMADRY